MKLSKATTRLQYSGGTANEANRLSREVKAGRLRRIVQGIYTDDMVSEPSALTQLHWREMVAHTYPGALLSHRSALEFEPSPAGVLYFTHSQDRVVRWPGLTLKMSKGARAGQDDRELFPGLHVSSEERALLENLMPARTSGGEKRTWPIERIVARLLRHLEARDERGLNGIRDTARARAADLGMSAAFVKLDGLIGTLLATRNEELRSPEARAHMKGEAYDPVRVRLFHRLAAALNREVFAERPERTRTPAAFRDLAFFESYFSNYIEGTEFEVAEAADIVYRGARIPNRTGDSHDMLGTFELCSDRAGLSHMANNAEEFIDMLRTRHRILLGGRPDKDPGMFKERANRAGVTAFVEPGRVRGTLKAGFDHIAQLSAPLAKALYIMFVVSEVHPFNDGNGRIARLMMNAELVRGARTKLLIPTVYREDYLLALRKLTRQQEPDAFIRMMARAHAWSHWLEPVSYERLHQQMLLSNAYSEPGAAQLLLPA